jgi:hypothetical protein
MALAELICQTPKRRNVPPRLEETKPHTRNDRVGLLHCASWCLGVFVAERVFFSSLLDFGSVLEGEF